MPNFSTMTDTEIVEFLEKHIHEITDDPSDDFPNAIYSGLRLGVLFTVKTEAAFAFIAKRQKYGFPDPIDAQLVFLYTLPESRHAGAASRLLDEIKRDHLDGSGMTLLCCGDQRRNFFARHNFRVLGDDSDPYEMRYDACGSSS